MDSWMISTKVVILSYCILRYALGGFRSPTGAVLFFLLYLGVNMLYHTVKPGWWRSALSLFSIVLSGFFSYYLDPVFMLLLPVNACELITGISESVPLLLAVSAIPVVVILGSSIAAEYLLAASLACIVSVLSHKMQEKLRKLTVENDEMRQKIYALNSRLDRDAEYQRQLRYLSQLEERNKIAQEIHDKIGHSISGSIIQLEAANLVARTDAERARAMIQNVTAVLGGGLESIRLTLRNIKPPSEQLGINRVKLLLDEFSSTRQIRTSLVYRGGLESVTHIQWKVIYENINEALTNASRHSGANSISVCIEVLNTFIKVEVHDNGVGAYDVKKGLGIKGMEERSGNIGGKVIIDGSRGFSVITLLPLKEV